MSASCPISRRCARYIAHCARFAAASRPGSPSQSQRGVVDSARALARSALNSGRMSASCCLVPYVTRAVTGVVPVSLMRHIIRPPLLRLLPDRLVKRRVVLAPALAA
ncbi:hypothetical protein [Streptomyces fildesensis]|uniref:hypothetical protein n=1 Tax=Streptomyces fildesensis TaxID=375757 RepID=UPI0018DF9545|nr:hypothetical protein [Streptomyces fildesensis]